MLALSAEVQKSMGGEEKREEDNGDQNTGSQENNDTNEADKLSNTNSNISQQPIHLLEKSCHNSYSDSTWDRIKNESTKKDVTSRKESVDSTEDSGEWDDPELISFLPHFLTIENQQVEPRIQFSVRLQIYSKVKNLQSKSQYFFSIFIFSTGNCSQI